CPKKGCAATAPDAIDRPSRMADGRPIAPGLFDVDAGEPRLIAAECVACGRRQFPAAAVCPYCAADGTREIREIGRASCRENGDWSSDVCSSDLVRRRVAPPPRPMP